MPHSKTKHLSDFNSIHFIGIGGIGMSALARLCLTEGKKVSGSDRSPSDITRALELEGAKVFGSHAKENIGDETQVVVYTEAVNEKTEGYEELLRAREKGIVTMNYFDALGMVANEYYLIAVAGAHGKTTTTAMLIDIFEEAGLDPSAVVGSLRAKTKSNYRRGKSKYFIVEACEYKRDFLSLEPDVLIITNIEHEHVDYYKNLDGVQQAFRELAEKVSPDGVVIANLSDQNVRTVYEGLSCAVIDYGKYFDPVQRLKVPGVHNQMNAAAARAAAEYVGIKSNIIRNALQEFKGTWRRFEYKGECNGAPVYDDYGHHPTEIKATLEGARELYPDKKITLVFQPHTYSRVAGLFNDFVSALSSADHVFVLPIYAAREENTTGVSSEGLVTAIGKTEKEAKFVETFDEVIALVKESVSKDDVVVVMGAGDITQIARALTENKKVVK